jgi:GAF domain-containing protein
MQATNSIVDSYPGQPAKQFDLLRPLLELALVQTSAQGAYVYRLEAGQAIGSLLAWAGLAPRKGSAVFPAAADPTTWQRERFTPVVLDENAWMDWRFRDFVEFERHRFEGAVSVPLVDGERLVGVVNFCHTRRLTLLPRDLSLLLNLAVPLGSLLAATDIRRKLESELEQTKQQLEDRKLVERAKRLLQTRFRWTEERAYFHIRRLSRQQRVPVRNIAAEVIEAAGIHMVAPSVGGETPATSEEES